MSLNIDYDKTPLMGTMIDIDRDQIWDELLGPRSIVVDSAQRAVQISLELLNSGVKGFPVVMPVTAPPEVLAGVLRSVAVPLLLDISLTTLDMDLALYKVAQEEFGDSMVTLFCELPGQPINQELLDCLPPHAVTILYSPTFPRDETVAHPHTFLIKDLKKLVDKGAVIFHDYEEQFVLLHEARDGVLGHDAKLTPKEEIRLELALKKERRTGHYARQEKWFNQILAAFAPTNIGITWDRSMHNEEFGIIVPDAQGVLDKLRKAYYKAHKVVKPLHFEAAVAARYKEATTYPNAEAVMNKLIAIPVMDYRSDSLKDLVGIIQKEY